jgi:hypothetical protein
MAPESERANEVLEVWAVISWALQCRSNCLLFGKHSAEEMWLALLGTLAHIRDDYGLYRRDWEKAKGKQVLSQFIAERGIKPSKQQRINEERHEANEGMTKPNEPTLTCSEVVERLGLCILAGKNCFSTGGTSFCAAQFDHERDPPFLARAPGTGTRKTGC